MRTTGLMMTMTTPALVTYLDNNMNELDTASHYHIDWVELFKFIGYGLFAVLIWVLKRFGEDHLASVKELAVELREMRKELTVLSSRVTAIEVRSERATHND